MSGLWRAVREAGSLLWYAARLPWRYARLPGVLLLLQAVLGGAAEPLVVWGIAGLLNALTQAVQASADPWPSALPWVGLLLGAFAIQSASGAAGKYLAEVTREHLQTGMQRKLFEHAVAVPLAALEHPEYYQRLETGSQAVHGDVAYNVRIAADLVEGITSAAGLLLLYFRAHWALGLLLLATTAVRSVLRAGHGRVFARVNYEDSPRRREMAYWSGLLSSRQVAPEIRLFGLAETLLGRWRAVFRRHLAEISAARWQMERIGWVEHGVQEAVTLSAVVALLLLAQAGRVSIGELVALLYGLGRVRDLTWTFTYTSQELARIGTELSHLRAFYALPAEQRLARPQSVPRPMREGVRFHNVTFSYAASSLDASRNATPPAPPGAALDRERGARPPALSGVDLLLRPGEHVALVGENGAGKTTLVKLLLGLYRPTEGRITVDGVDLADVDPAAWRREATAILQDFVRYHTTVGENIAYADVSVLATGGAGERSVGVARASADGTGGSDRPGGAAESRHLAMEAVPPRLAVAAAESGAAVFIAELPNGYATPLGKEVAGGVELSAGQWQRLALARAYLRDAQLVVLDEPTAALDPRAEVEVYRQFSRAAAGRCAVLISHRLGSARLADRIVVLRDGRVVEEGTHESLLRLEGEYARMFRLQAAWYADADGGGGVGGQP